jgi:hypothetical protein
MTNFIFAILGFLSGFATAIGLAMAIHADCCKIKSALDELERK